jgi:hypothetical protein
MFEEERWLRLLRQIFYRVKWKICRLWVIHGPARGLIEARARGTVGNPIAVHAATGSARFAKYMASGGTPPRLLCGRAAL